MTLFMSARENGELSEFGQALLGGGGGATRDRDRHPSKDGPPGRRFAEETMKTETQVLSFEKTGDKPGSWLKINTIDDKGTSRVAYIKDQGVIPIIAKPGFYEFEKKKEGKYWDIVGAKFLRPVGDVQPATNGHAAPAAAKVPGAVDPNVLIQNRAITSQVCVKAAAELLGKALDNGAFKLDGGVIDTMGLSDSAALLARVFMAEAKEFVSGKVDAKPEKKPVTPEGA